MVGYSRDKYVGLECPVWCRYQQCFHGVDLSSLRQAAMKEYFRQPIVDTFDMRVCMSKSVRHIVDFQEAEESDLHRIGE
jgi:histone-arginine methyltransferase CARM1